MSLLTPNSVSGEGGVSLGKTVVLELYPNLHILETSVEWMRFCDVCNAEHRFVANVRCSTGLVGCCSNCEEYGIAPFTRANSEAA
jgi:hypothetical protein